MPLQIFEQRYLDLVRETMRSGEPFGVIWIRRGLEVAERGEASPDLGDYGTCARIVDWDQLPNGLLGITVEGIQRFELLSTTIRANGLIQGEVDMVALPEPVKMLSQWQSLLDVLQSLQTHPHVQSMGLDVDYNNAWQVAYTLIQLLPLDEAIKYELLGMDEIDNLMQKLDVILNQISGEEAN